MELKKVFISELSPAEYNPRKDLRPGDPEFESIRKSIEEYGYADPIIINADYTVIGGHQRLKVLKELGFMSIDAIVLDIDKKHEKGLNLALNKITGSWDMEKLSALMKDLDLEGFDLDLTGFSQMEAAELLHWGETPGAPDPSDEWQGMPEFNQGEELGVKRLIVHFGTWEDVRAFSELVGQKITEKTKWIWFPELVKENLVALEYQGTSQEEPEDNDE